MPNWMKLGIPIGLGVLAALLNYAGRSAEMAPVGYVRVNQELGVGKEFKEDHLERIDLPKNLGSLEKTAIPWRDRAVLYGRPSPRDLKKGDLVLWRDATPPAPGLALEEGEVALHLSLEGISSSLPSIVKVGDRIGFYLPRRFTLDPKNPPEKEPAEKPSPLEYVGPFRVLSIGKRVSADIPVKTGAFSAAEEREITLAIKPLDGMARPDEITTRLLTARMSRQETLASGAIVIIPHKK